MKCPNCGFLLHRKGHDPVAKLKHYVCLECGRRFDYKIMKPGAKPKRVPLRKLRKKRKKKKGKGILWSRGRKRG